MLVFLLLLVLKGVECSYQNEKYLHKMLLTDYNTNVRPQVGNTTLNIHFDMRLKSLVELNVRNQVLIINAFTMLKWTDEQLKWNKTLLNDTDRINIESSLIWTPDIMLYNTAELTSYEHTDLYKTRPLIFSSGQVIWNAPVSWKISCELDITWFPVDRQICNFSFGSNSYSKSQLDLRFWSKPSSKAEILSDNFHVESGEWTIEELDSFEELVTFICCPEPFSTIKYRMVVTRLSLYYFLYIILPLVSLSFLFLLVFHIPHDSGERMGFGVTILLSITVYLLVISEKLPEKSDVYPMLGVCFIVIFYILCFALACAAATTIFARKSSKPPSFLLGWSVKRKKEKIKVVPKKTSLVTKAVSSFNDPENVSKKDAYAGEEEEEEEKDYTREWMQICRYFDKRLFFVFNALILIIPLIVIGSLSKDGLA